MQRQRLPSDNRQMPVIAESSESNQLAVPNQRSQKERLVLSGVIVGVALLFLVPCLFEKSLVACYTKILIPELAAMIPAALSRYCLWVIAAGVIFAALRGRLLGNLRDLSFKSELIVTALFATLLNVLILTRTWQFPYCIDDAYIIFRYADNMVTHGMPDFDIGSHVNTISSQLHFLLLVGSSFLTGQRDFPLLSESINLVQEICSLFFLFAILKRVFAKAELALYGCAIHVMSSYAILEVVRGKEGSLIILLLFLSMWSSLNGRERLSAWVSALLCLGRPEGFLFAAVSFVSRIREYIGKPVSALKLWALPGVMVAAVFASIYFYYGTIMPQGVLAKSVIYHAPNLVCASLIDAQICSALIGPPLCPGGIGGVLLLVAFYGVFLVVLWRYEFLRVYFVSLFLITIFFCAGNSLMNAFPWYLSWWAPLPPLFYVAVLKQLQDLRRVDVISKTMEWTMIALSMIVVPFHSYCQFATFSTVISPLPIFYWDNVSDRLRIYESARVYLNKYAKKTDTVAVVEVGVIGYKFDGRIFDLLGLVTPEALKLYPVPVDKQAPCGLSIPPQYAELYKPERMLFLDCFARNGLLKDPYFKENYRLEWFWRNDAFESVGVYLYKKTEALEPRPRSSQDGGAPRKGVSERAAP